MSLLVATSLLIGAAAAELPSVELHYQRASSAERCPDQGTLERAVAAVLGYDPFRTPAERRISVRIHPEPGGDRLDAEVAVVSDTGEFLGQRRSSGAAPDCRELAQALTLTLSLVIDPESLGTAATPIEPSEPQRHPFLSEIAAPPAPKPSEYRWHVALGVLGAVGSAPQPSFGLRAGGQWRERRWSLELEARADLPSGETSLGIPFTSSLLVGGVVPCWRFAPWEACAVALAGAEISSAQGSQTRSAVDPYGAVGGRLAVQLPLEKRWGLRLVAELLTPFGERRFRVDLPNGLNSLWITPPLQATLGVDLLLGI